MPIWATIMTTLAAMIGGGVGAKLIGLVAYRQQDATRARDELWREIGELRQSARDATSRADRQATKIESLEQQVSTLTINRYGWRTLANALRTEVLRLMSQINERDAAAGHGLTYDLSAEESRMVASAKALDGGA